MSEGIKIASARLAVEEYDRIHSKSKNHEPISLLAKCLIAGKTLSLKEWRNYSGQAPALVKFGE